MNHEQFREWTQLLLYDELTGDERQKAEAHLQTCEECRGLFEELKKLHSVLARYQQVEVGDQLLHEARTDLQAALRGQVVKQPWWRGIGQLITTMIYPPYRVALGGAATLAVGFLLGYAVFKSSPLQEQPPPVMQVQNAERPLIPEGGQIANVKFTDADARDGEVEFTFDAIMPMHMKGKVNDPKIQQVLSYALLNEQNPGVRLRSVSAMASEQATGTDADVKHVLVTALKSDGNPGVRKEALKALQKFPFDNEIRKAFMDALVHDMNPAIRIGAINALDSATTRGSAVDHDLLTILKERMKSDNNQYIRIRARSVLQELSQ